MRTRHRRGCPPRGAQATDHEPTARQRVWDSFPTAMQDESKAAVQLQSRPRHAALQGAYGDEVQALAGKRRAFVQGCPGVARPFVGDGSVAA